MTIVTFRGESSTDKIVREMKILDVEPIRQELFMLHSPPPLPPPAQPSRQSSRIKCKLPVHYVTGSPVPSSLPK
jgi:hypothetical protein